MDKVKFKKKLKGSVKSKRMWFSFVVMLMGCVQANIQFLNPILTPQTAGWSLFVIGIISGIVGWFTTKPLDEK